MSYLYHILLAWTGILSNGPKKKDQKKKDRKGPEGTKKDRKGPDLENG